MIKIKSFILDETNWLEVVWVNEKTTTNIVKKEVDGVLTEVEEINTTETQVHCESYSGHPEHIAMLRAKALEFGTELDEAMITECITNFKMPTAEEIAEQELKVKIAEAKAYLVSTDFKMTVDYYATLTIEQQEELTMMRAAARDFLKEQGL